MFPCVDGRGSSSSTSTASVLTTGVDTVWDLLFSASKYQYITDPEQSTIAYIGGHLRDPV